MEHVFKLFEFNVYNDKGHDKDSEEEEEEVKVYKDSSQFIIQMFGINNQGEKASIFVDDYQPFFYVKVDNNWNQRKKEAFYAHLKANVGKYYEDSITKCKLIERKKLYGFDAGKQHRFIELTFSNVNIFNKVKNFWYVNSTNEDGENERKLLKNGYKFDYNGKTTFIELYEAHLPPLLQSFHVREISPSGWVALPVKKTIQITEANKTTSCHFEFKINYKNIIPLNHMDDPVPYTKMSMDIEASSSHGDFPVPIKSYKKLATNIIDHFSKLDITNKTECSQILTQIIRAAFGFIQLDSIDIVYPKEQITNEEELQKRIENWLRTKVKDNKKNESEEEHLIEKLFENANKAMQNKEKDEKDDAEDDAEDNSDDDSVQDVDVEEATNMWNKNKFALTKYKQGYKNTDSTIVDIMCDKTFEREGKVNELIRTLRNNFPPLEGDKVTFIGSTLMRCGESEPYLNHCIALNSCNIPNVQNIQIETYDTEREVLLAWTRLVQREDPDIIIGYNIFSFDYEFMFRRAQELCCVEDFLKLSRNKNELCATVDYKNPNKIDIDRSSTTVASGTYELAIIKMNGRLQVDMLNWFLNSFI